MALQKRQMRWSHLCSEGNKRCTATARRRDTTWGASIQTSTSRARRLVSPTQERRKEPQRPMMRGCLYLLATPASSVGTKIQMALCCTYCGRCALHNGNHILWHHTLWSTRTASVSLLSLSLRTHRWPWHTHRNVRNHLFFFFPYTSNNSTAKRMPLPLSRIPIRHASRHIHQPTATQSVNATQLPRMMPPHTPTRRPATRRKQCLDTQNRLPQTTTAPPSSEAGLVSNNQTTSPSSLPSAMHKVLLASCIIRDARALNE
ncbi:hypothetical protein TcCL_Unassigned04809 [Trypanosoma cruzi]|nr:hypothetical protein TcCL_Unassigned04809 [Trypanosoma cruzi]